MVIILIFLYIMINFLGEGKRKRKGGREIVNMVITIIISIVIIESIISSISFISIIICFMSIVTTHLIKLLLFCLTLHMIFRILLLPLVVVVVVIVVLLLINIIIPVNVHI